MAMTDAERRVLHFDPKKAKKAKHRYRRAFFNGMCGIRSNGRRYRYTDDVLDYYYVTEVLD